MTLFETIQEEVSKRLAIWLSGAVIAVLGSGLAGFRLARSQDADVLKAEVKAEVLQSIQPSLDSCTSKIAQVLFQLDQVLTPEQKMRATDNFNRAKANLGLK
jgi:hypothetical protein